MAVQNPFFGKRETETFPSRQTPTMPSSQASPVSQAGTVNGHGAALAAAAASASASAKAPVEGGGSKLTVGPNIKLKGVEITDCDTLVVEGTVEASMDSRVIQIAEQGSFRGSAEVDVAEIRGTFNGTLVVRQKLLIHSTGKVGGKIRYGKLVVEEGAQLSGEIEAGTAPRSVNASDGAPTALAA